MMNADDMLKVLASLGAVGSAATVTTAVIASKSSKGKSRAEAADLLVGAAERVGKMNNSLDDENHRLRTVIHEIHAALIKTSEGSVHVDTVLEIIKKLYDVEKDDK
jgi:hypothetical protein